LKPGLADRPPTARRHEFPPVSPEAGSWPATTESGRSMVARRSAVVEGVPQDITDYVPSVWSREVAAITKPLCGPEVIDSQVSRGRTGPCRRVGKWRSRRRDALPDPRCLTSTSATAAGVARVPSWSPVRLSYLRDSSYGGRRKRRPKASDTARFGRIDRRIREVTSRLHASLYACHHLLVNAYRSRLLRCRQTDARWRSSPSRIIGHQNTGGMTDVSLIKCPPIG
jgi:hypothetical protein